MKKGQILEGIVSRMDFPNKGVTETEEGIVSVKNVLPGQKIRLQVTKLRNGRAEGRLLSVLAPAPLENTPACPCFGSCGGCLSLSLPYEEQLAVKEQQVRRLLDACLLPAQGEYDFAGILDSPVQYGYRNKMEFSFGNSYKDGPLVLGMHRRGSFYDVDSAAHCQIVDEDFRQIVAATEIFFRTLPEKGREVTHFHRLHHTGYLRHLLIRKAAKTGEILAALVTTGQRPASWGEGEEARKTEEEILDDYKVLLSGLPLAGSFAGILHIRNDSVSDVVQSDETTVLFGRDYFYEELLGLRFRISVFSFFQTNSYGAEVLYDTVRRFVMEGMAEEKTDTPVIFDLYSGTGTIAQLMAPVAKKVVGVEIVEEAVEAAKENAALNGLSNCTFIAGDVLEVLQDLPDLPDFIILDPPRDGIHPKALRRILSYGVRHLVYVSCKPTSLVRDLEAFLAAGYRVEKAQAVDMFPWTGNVETVVCLRNQKYETIICGL